MAKDAIPLPRLRQLQAKNAGAWKTVLHFDEGDVVAAMLVRDGALALHRTAPSTSFRVVTLDKPPVVLRYLEKSNHGSWADTKSFVSQHVDGGLT